MNRSAAQFAGREFTNHCTEYKRHRMLLRRGTKRANSSTGSERVSTKPSLAQDINTQRSRWISLLLVVYLSVCAIDIRNDDMSVLVTAFTLTALLPQASVPAPKRGGPCQISTTSHDTVIIQPPESPKQQPTQCALCHQTFDSRNAMFRHVRMHHDQENNNRNSTDTIATTMKYTLAVWMGYNSQVSPTHAGRMIQDALESYPGIHTTNATTITSSTQVSVAKSRPICWNQESHCASAEDILVVKLLQVAVVSATAPFSSTPYLSLSSVTRHIQEYVNQTIAATHTNDTISEPLVRLHGLRILDVTTTSTITSNNNYSNERDRNNSSDYYASYNSKSFHAEQSCTQHEFHTLIPIQYLPLASQAEIRHWVHTSLDQTADAKRHNRAKMPTVILQLKSILRSMASPEIRPPASSSSAPNNQKRPNENQNHAHDENDICESDNNVRQSPPTSDTTTDIQDITSNTNHTAEDVTIQTSESMLQTQRQSQNGARGRFGALAYRVPQYWHNYGNPSLRLSPNNYEPVYRVIDRARIIDFIQLTTSPFDPDNSSDGIDSDIYLVCCIIGDELLQQQVRRMVATAIAMVHEWLPSNFLDYSINSNHIVETPMFPANLVYRAHSRFHWHEQYNQGRRIFDFNAIIRNSSHPHSDDVYITATEDPAKWMRRTIMSARTTSTPQPWMSELQNVVCPRIREQMVLQTRQYDSNLIQKQLLRLPPPPFEYVRVLTLLRSIASNKLWPATSLARSYVINTETSLSSPATTTNATDNTTHSTGSFTVVNTKIIPEHLELTLPKANKLFPELTAAVFELEGFIIRDNFGLARATLLDDPECNAIETIFPYTDSNQHRSPSTHCAVNCNAQFKPHVDSGRGLGQSVSMIVGLGDYYGGEITVEQARYPIRYRPIEFDGWKLRHWTRPFFGSDRFTLVWFTPATSTTTTKNL